MNTLISKQVTYEYRNAVQTVRAVNGVSCAFQQGQVYAIVGSSGSGKTTFLSLLAGLDVPTSGTIELDGESTAKMNRDSYRLNHVSVIYQNFNLFQHLTVLECGLSPVCPQNAEEKSGRAGSRKTPASWIEGGSVQAVSQYALRRGAAASGYRPRANLRQ